jgi:hypothetical protein
MLISGGRGQCSSDASIGVGYSHSASARHASDEAEELNEEVSIFLILLKPYKLQLCLLSKTLDLGWPPNSDVWLPIKGPSLPCNTTLSPTCLPMQLPEYTACVQTPGILVSKTGHNTIS